jgi:myo-inositol-1(or 4)-monophosphatase
VKPADVGWKRLLEDATERVQSLTSAVALSPDRTKVLGTGASGDKTLVADKEAEEELLRSLSRVDGLRVLSEEAGSLGDAKATPVAVLDPVDGSANFERGIPFYCTSVAIAEGNTLEDVAFAIVRNLVNGDVYWAEKGQGSTKNGKRIRASAVGEPSAAVVAIDLSRGRTAMVKGLATLVGAVRRQVHFGANALELCYLAEGRVDAFVDLRGKMRVTDFAAAYLIAKEAGCFVTGGAGEALNPKLTLDERFSYVAAGSAGLHGKIMTLCKDASGGRDASS